MSEGDFGMGWVVWLLITVIVFIVALQIIGVITSGDVAEEKCKKIGMEVLDYNLGNAFTNGQTTCIHPITKETKQFIN